LWPQLASAFFLQIVETNWQGLESMANRATSATRAAKDMESLVTKLAMVAALSMPSDLSAPQQEANWCTPGYVVMIPDGREGFVSSVDGEMCRIIAAGEKYVTLLPHYIVEPVYPQPFPVRAYR
jgi:hypothetical protein